ncbi:MAG: site-2 protease family protein, partial [Candidatus Magasanikbacteria bacterium]
KNLILGQGMVFEVSGPVGIASVIGNSLRLGFSYLLNVTAMISLSLAVINILPIPALDGGRIFFVAMEKLLGRRVPDKWEQLAHTAGFVLLMGLIIVVTYRDIVRVF